MRSAFSWIRREAWLLAALGLGAALFFWPLATGRHLVPFHVLAGDPALEGIDLAADRADWRFFDSSPITMFYAQKAQAARALREGEPPLWNPWAALGVPLLANGQSQPFAPFFLPFLARPTPWVYSLCILAQLLFGGWGMGRLLKRLGCRPGVRAFGALLFAFNPYALNFAVYSDVWAYAWFPWIFDAGEGWVRKETGWRRIPVLLTLVAVSGHLEEAFFGATSAFAYLAVRLIQERGRVAEWARWAAIPWIAAGLSALWLLPFLEYLANVTSPRFGGNVPYPYHPSALFVVGGELFLPPALAGLAGAAFLSSRGRRLALALLPAFLWAAAMAFPFPEVLQRAVTFDFLSGRYGRSLLWFLLIGAGSLGADAVAAGLSRGRRWMAGLAAGLVFLLGLGVRPPALEVMTARHWVPLLGSTPADHPALLAAGAAAVLLLFLSGSLLGTRTCAAALVGLSLASLLPFHAAFGVYWNRSDPRPAAAVLKAAEAGRLWFGHVGKWKSFPPNLGTAFGVPDIRLCDPFVPRRLEALGWPRASHQDLFEAWDEARARFVGVSAVLKVLPGPGGGLFLERVNAGEPPGRAFVAQEAVAVASPREALREALERGPRSAPIFLEGPEGREGLREARSFEREGAVRLRRESSLRQVWKVTAPEGGWFVVKDLYWPGWKARVDGNPAAIRPADGLFRAVALPPGDHEVEFRYRPPSFFLGAALSALTAIALLVCRWRRS